MGKIVLVANLNCDRVLQLDKPLQTGGRFHYQDAGQRLGGGGANTGMGLTWAGHRVALVSQVGEDQTGDWLLAQASTQGLDCHLISRHQGNTDEMLLIMTPDGERTIIRSKRPVFELPSAPTWQHWDALYINSSAKGAAGWAQNALEHCLVVAQLAKDNHKLPCHILLASESDLAEHGEIDPWGLACDIAGDALQYFIVTQGDKGALLYSKDSCIHKNAITADLVDTTGAGDAYAGGLIHGMLAYQDIHQAMAEASQWGAFAVATPSSTPGELLLHYLTKV